MDFFVVKSGKRDNGNYGTIYARMRSYGYNRKYSLGLTLRLSEWKRYTRRNYKSGDIIPTLGISYSQLAFVLLKIRQWMESAYEPEHAAKTIRGIIFSTLCDFHHTAEKTAKKSRKKKILLREYLLTYIEELKSGVRTKQRVCTKVSVGYITNMQSALRNLELFEEAKNIDVALDDVDMTFQRRFVAFMRERGLCQNTICTRVSCIHCVMSDAYNEKKTRQTEFQNPEFIPTREVSDKIYIDSNRLQQLQQMDLSSIQSLERLTKNLNNSSSILPVVNYKVLSSIRKTRDIFLMGCLTGQRISDYSRISTSMLTTISNKPFLKLKQLKTNKLVYIPYSCQMGQILERNGGRMPYVCRSTYSHYLRLIGELLGWTQQALPDSSDNTKRLCDMITSHTARRSFVTNAYTAGVPLSSIMTVTGHSSEKTLRIYLRLNSLENALVAERDFRKYL